MSTTQAWMNAWQDRVSRLPGAAVPWLADTRQRAIERFADEGWPAPRQEGWRTTSLAALSGLSFTEAPIAASPHELVAGLRQGDSGHWLVFVDGRHAPELSDLGEYPTGVRIEALSKVLDSDPEWVEPYFGSPSDGASPAALNLALAGDGAFIRIPSGVEIEQPVHLLFLSLSNGAAVFPRNIIVLEEGARATVVEHYAGAGTTEATLTDSVTRIDAAARSHLTHLKLQQESVHAFHLAAIDVIQQRDSTYNSHSLSFGAGLARNDIGTRFEGEHCETLFNGLYYVDGRRHVDHHTLIDHAKPNGNSRETYRGILDGRARGVFRGRILVAPGADRTDAQQRSDNLLLSRLARADARPELEIYAEDVKCTHGATVGQLDANSLFYLRTRGLDETRARGVLTYAFASEILDRIELDPLRRRAEDAIRALLPDGGVMKEAA